MEPWSGLSTATPSFFVFGASDVPRELENAKTGTINYTVEFEEIQRDATVGTYLFIAKLLYMFRASIAPIVRSI